MGTKTARATTLVRYRDEHIMYRCWRTAQMLLTRLMRGDGRSSQGTQGVVVKGSNMNYLKFTDKKIL